MSDDPSDDHNGSQTTTSFEEWIKQQAEIQGISRQELFEQLVSSYWTVNEMAELVGEPGDDPALPTSVSDGSDGGSTDSEPGAPAEEGGSELEDIDSFEELRERLENLETEFDPEARDPSGQDVVSALVDRLTRLEADLSSDRPEGRRHAGSVSLDASDSRSERRSSASGLQDRIDTLDDRLEAIEDGLTDEQERTQSQDEFLEAVAERLNRIEARIDDLASETETGRKLLADRVDGVESDVDELAGEVESVNQSLSSEYESVTGRLDDIESSVDGRHRQLTNEQQRLRSRLDAEFDDLETILEHLVTQTDDLDSGLAAVEQRHDDDLSKLRRERDALRSLLAEAAERDVHTGECEVCGGRVNFDLLADPYCSGCGSLLTGIEEHDRWLLFSDVVVTAEDDRTGPAVSEASPTRRGGDTAPSSLGQAGRRDPASRPADEQSDPAGADQTGPTGPAPEAGPAGSVLDNEASDDSPVDHGSIDSGRSDDGASAVDDAAGSESGFMFGDLGARSDATGGSESDSTASADDDHGSSGAETTADMPFGDLEELKREEQRDDTS